MNSRTRCLLAALTLSGLGCSDGTTSNPAPVDAAADVTPGTDVLADAPAPRDVVVAPDAPAVDAPAAGDAASCAASDAGALQSNDYCDFGAIHVLQHDGAPAEVEVQARVGISEGCATADSIEILRGSASLQRFDVGRAFQRGLMGAVIGRAPAAAALVSACSDDATRLSAYGIIVRGRNAMGPFEARCGAAESGSRWPPGTSLACHRNLDRPPLAIAASSIQVSNVGPTRATMFSFNLPHAEGHPALTTVSGALRVVSPQRASFVSGAPLMSADSTGWMGSVTEGGGPAGPSTQVVLNAIGAVPLAAELCPTPSMGTMPTPPPYFLARVTGVGPAGPVTVEVLASCVTYSMGL